MPRTIVIPCTEKGVTYNVSVTGSTDALRRAANDTVIETLQGEKQVAAILKKGGISQINRKTLAEKLNDSPLGKPAIQEFDKQGRRSHVARYENGLRTYSASYRYQDNSTGWGCIKNYEAAREEYEPTQEIFDLNKKLMSSEHRKNGELTWKRHYKNGVLHDSEHGEWAVQVFDKGNLTYAERYKNGIIKQVEHRKNWKLSDTSDGRPALQRFNSKGQLIFKAHYDGGKLADAFREAALNRYKAHYDGGKLADALREAALNRYKDGKLSSKTHYVGGTLVKKSQLTKV